MQAFCNIYCDFHLEKTDLGNQIAAFLNISSFKNNIMD